MINNKIKSMNGGELGRISLLSGLLLALVLTVIFNLPVLFSEKVSGETGGDSYPACDLNGWAWSGYEGGTEPAGVGWISFNSSDSNAGGGPYKVVVDEEGILSGYAWASPAKDDLGNDSIGWIKFDPIGPYPETPNHPVRFDRDPDSSTFGQLIGWARSCGVFASGCSGTLKDDMYRGGWDGWIKLSGTSANGAPYGVSWDNSNRNFSGYAWGSNENIGWISFSGTGYGVTLSDPQACAPKTGTDFRYQLRADNLPFETPSGRLDVEHSIEIRKVSGTADEVRITNVYTPNEIPPEVTLDFDYPDQKCTPNTSCSITVDVGYESTLDRNEQIYVRVDTDSDTGEEIGTGGFLITLKADDDSLACQALPNTAFRRQPVTWEAIAGRDLNVIRYEWSGHDEIAGAGGKNVEIVGGYPEQGIKKGIVAAYGEGVDGSEIFLKDAECTLQILPDIYFDHI